MRFRRQSEEEPVEESDPTGWMIDGGLADFLLMHTYHIKYMCMLGYTFMHGSKLYPTFPNNVSTSFKFVSMILRCTGGGILVPLFLNRIPVPLANDAYPVAIVCSFLLHEYCPILRSVMKLSNILQVALLVLYEVVRASVVVQWTYVAGQVIPPSDFSNLAVFGPILCGALAGCGGVFLPFDKGLGPIQTVGMGQPMQSALVAATCFHLFLHTSWSEGVQDAKEKAHVCVVVFFIAYNLYTTFYGNSEKRKEPTASDNNLQHHQRTPPGSPKKKKQ